MEHWLPGILIACFFALGAQALGAAEPSEEESLYYAASARFDTPSSLEVRLLGAHELSNPFLNVYGLGAGAYYLQSPSLSYGIEVIQFTTSKRGSTETLEKELGDYGFRLRPLVPEQSLAGAFRLTPLSGLVNFFSSRVFKAELGLTGRVGAVRYQNVSPGVLLGTGLDVALSFSPRWGAFTALQWEWDKVSSHPWQSRVGLRLGPVFRF